MDLEGRMAKMERRLDATLKIVQTGMKLLVKMQEDARQMKEDTRQMKEDTRALKKEMREGINALVAAQMRTEEKLDRFITSLGRSGANGHTR
jgi:hypothetical protein